MLLDLSRLRTGVEKVDRTEPPAAFDLDGEEFRLVQPVHLVIEARKDAKKIRLVGRVQTTLDCDCSRCLEAFSVPVDAAIDMLYLPASEREEQAGEQEVNQADAGVSYYDNDVIDLGELVREQFYLVLPMKPLCREDCQGLCPVCGVNRNRETCTCETSWTDPRLDVLKKLKTT
jgi:uncharacterized protein